MGLAFNLLNDIDLPGTEARIAEFQRKNSALIAANQDLAVLEALCQVERDEVEKRARGERMRMVEEAERVEREEEGRVKSEIVEALVSSPKIPSSSALDRGAEGWSVS